MVRLVIIPALALSGGCLLEPLVEDDPGASVHILPADAEVPRIDDDPELVHQITVNDGLDDGDLEDAGGVVARVDGLANGVPIKYWAFGNANRIGAAMYVLMEPTQSGPRRVEAHPYLFDSLPGEPTYSAFRRINYVMVTPAYAGEKLTTLRALTDAIELGLVEEPELAGTWVNAPVVPPGTTLEIADGAAAPPIEVYAGGYVVDAFELGGDRGVQPLRGGSIPMGQASVVREDGAVAFGKEPIFQFAAPAEAPSDGFNYTAMVTMVEVDLATGVAADAVAADADLFTRSGSGAITGITANVERFAVTTTIRNWPMQFEEGAP